MLDDSFDFDSFYNSYVKWFDETFGEFIENLHSVLNRDDDISSIDD